MKIRQDFVTNSSSTSFILIVKDDFNEDEFLSVLGIKMDSKFNVIFKELYHSVCNNMEPIRDAHNRANEYNNRSNSSNVSFEEFVLGERHSRDILYRILEAEKAGKKVFIGELSSDNNTIEAFFCTNSFLVESDSIYFNGYICAW